MVDKDLTRIRVGDHEVGLIGLRQAMDAIASSHAGASDEEVKEALLESLSAKNYIPSSARQDYGKAFVREFRSFLGQPCEEPADGPLKIVVLGPGCSQCDRLEQTVMHVLAEMDLPASLEHVSDINEIATYGHMRLPALIVNGKVVAAGLIPSTKKIKEWLAEAEQSESV